MFFRLRPLIFHGRQEDPSSKGFKDSDPPPCCPGMRKMYGIIEPRKSKVDPSRCPGQRYRQFLYIDHPKKKACHELFGRLDFQGIFFLSHSYTYMYIFQLSYILGGKLTPQTHAKISRNQTATKSWKKISKIQNPYSRHTSQPHCNRILKGGWWFP